MLEGTVRLRLAFHFEPKFKPWPTLVHSILSLQGGYLTFFFFALQLQDINIVCHCNSCGLSCNGNTYLMLPLYSLKVHFVLFPCYKAEKSSTFPHLMFYWPYGACCKFYRIIIIVYKYVASVQFRLDQLWSPGQFLKSMGNYFWAYWQVLATPCISCCGVIVEEALTVGQCFLSSATC